MASSSWVARIVVGVTVLGPATTAVAEPEQVLIGQAPADNASGVTLRLLRDKGIITPQEYDAAVRELAPHHDPAVHDGPRITTSGVGTGVTLHAPRNLFSMTLRARFHLRATTGVPAGEVAGTREVNVRRMRLYISGHVLNRELLTYNFHYAFGARDFEAGNPSNVFDANLVFTPLRDLNIRAGQFLLPFNRSRWTSAWQLQLVDRSAALAELTLDRDPGIDVFSRDLWGLGGRIQYNMGIYAGMGRNRVNTKPFRLLPADPSPSSFITSRGIILPQPNLMLLGRLQFNPFGSFDEPPVATGSGAGTESDVARDGRLRMAFGLAAALNQGALRRQSVQGEFYTAGSFDYAHAALDFQLKYRGISVLAETLVRVADRAFREGRNERGTFKDWSRSAAAWQVQAGYQFTSTFEFATRIAHREPLEWDGLTPAAGWPPTPRWSPVDLTTPRATDPALTPVYEAGVGATQNIAGPWVKVQEDYFYVTDGNLARGEHQLRIQLQVAL